MLRGQTTIGRVSARCPAGTEPLIARIRLSRLLAGADLAPRGFPPRAVLVIRRAKARRVIPLGASVLRPELEREMREQVSALWRRAARAARGRVPECAEAVLFEDEGEWLAALGLAAVRGEVGRHWCWRAPSGEEAAAAPPRRTLVRSWARSPRFLPAALVRLAHWGEAARVLGALTPDDVGTLFSALSSEYDLPQTAHASDAPFAHPTPERGEPGATTRRHGARARVMSGGERDETSSAPRICEDAPRGERAERSPTEEEASPPWARWLPSAGGECERMHPTAQRLLAYAAALYHAPTLARGRDFSEEVNAFSQRGEARPRLARESARATDPRTYGDDEVSAPGNNLDAPASAAGEATAEHTPDLTEGLDAPQASHLTAVGEGDAGETKTRPASTGSPSGRHEAEAPPEVSDESDEPPAEARAAPWASLDGCETMLGGALFLLNLFVGLRLPECFDEDYRLSEHVTGWGLTELLSRWLLGESAAEFEGDPLWGALARLDGRAGGEPPAMGLSIGPVYRAPARWLKLFPPRAGDAWLFSEEGGGMTLRHSAGFTVATLPLEGFGAAGLAARLADEYRAQGVRVPRLEEGARLAPPTFEGLRTYGGAPLPAGLRRWMGWAFPFLSYALRRSLADDEEGPGGDASARELIVRRGRLFCTATHVDLVMEASTVSFAARRSGLDASPGWVRDLVRVVAFHYE